MTKELKVPVTIVGEGKSPIALVTDAARSPEPLLKVSSAKVTRQGNGGARVNVSYELSQPPVPVSFDLFLRVGGKEYPMGYFVGTTRGSTSSGGQVKFPSLAADVTTADVIFRPNPKHAESVPGIEQVWGKEVVIKDVKLERYDLEAAAATQPTE
jgi:hypothetical protein